MAPEVTTPKITVTAAVNAKPVTFEVDCSAACTMISSDTSRAVWPTNPPELTRDDIHLHTWYSQELHVLGMTMVTV